MLPHSTIFFAWRSIYAAKKWRGALMHHICGVGSAMLQSGVCDAPLRQRNVVWRAPYGKKCAWCSLTRGEHHAVKGVRGAPPGTKE